MLKPAEVTANREEYQKELVIKGVARAEQLFNAVILKIEARIKLLHETPANEFSFILPEKETRQTWNSLEKIVNERINQYGWKTLILPSVRNAIVKVKPK